jgi:cytochrome c oxidase cbb3-type subunit 2
VAVVERGGEAALADDPALRALFSGRADRTLPLRPSPEGLAFSRETDGIPALDIGGLPEPQDTVDTWKGRTLTVIVPTEELRGLVAYIQKLGTNRGAWRDAFEPQALSVSVMSVPRTEAQEARGRVVYERRCVGCHGAKGDGNGPVATFLDPRPRDFRRGVFKFRSTPSGSLPTDGDLYRTLTRGVRHTAMPTWHDLPEQDRIAAISYLKTFSPRWTEERPEPPIPVGDPPKATAALLAQGKVLYATAKCAQCHGEGGKGDGPSADDLRDDWGFRILPIDFTRGQFKGGADVRDVFRTMTAGLDGTPMPSFADSMNEAERWAISYHVLSFSAFNDPLTGEKLRIDPALRARLSGAAGEAYRSSRLALDPSAPDAPGPRALVRFHRGLAGEGR